MRGSKTDPEIEAMAAAALMAGRRLIEVSREYDLPYRTVQRIAENLGGKLAEVGTKRLESIGDMLVDLLDANFEGMKAIALKATDEDYTEKHSPTALAELYATISDTSVRLLEAAGSVADAVEESGE